MKCHYPELLQIYSHLFYTTPQIVRYVKHLFIGRQIEYLKSYLEWFFKRTYNTHVLYVFTTYWKIHPDIAHTWMASSYVFNHFKTCTQCAWLPISSPLWFLFNKRIDNELERNFCKMCENTKTLPSRYLVVSLKQLH